MKYPLLLLSIFIITIQTQAQFKLGSYGYHNSYVDYGICIQYDKQSNKLYIVQETQDTITSDFYHSVLKISPKNPKYSDELKFEKDVSEFNFPSRCDGFAMDSESNLYISGSRGYIDSAGIGKYKGVVTKFDTLGNRYWRKEYFYGKENRFTGIERISDNSFAIAQIVYPNIGYQSYLRILYIDSTGAETNATILTQDTVRYDELVNLQATPDSGLLVASTSYYKNDASQAKRERVIRLDKAGKLMWEKHPFKGKSANNVVGLACPTLNNQVIAGMWHDTIYWDYKFNYTFNTAILDSLGSKIFQDTFAYRANLIFSPNYMIPLKNGDAMVMGRGIETYTNNQGSYVGTIGRIKPDGSYRWVRAIRDTFITKGANTFFSAVELPSGNIAISGAFEAYNNHGFDAWLVITDSMGCVTPGCDQIVNYVTSTQAEPKQISNDEGLVKLYPNPTSQELTIELKANIRQSEQIKIIISDMLGRKLKEYKKTYFDKQLSIDVSSISWGNYMLSIYSGDLLLGTKMFVKM